MPDATVDRSSTDAPVTDAADPAATGAVTVYWRPMCGYCTVLKADLDDRGVAYDAVDIWHDRASAEVVRRATGGDEIVPTVRVRDRFMVNPTADEVVAALTA